MEKPDSRKGENSLSIFINEMERSAFERKLDEKEIHSNFDVEQIYF